MVHERCVPGTGEVLQLRVSGQVRLGNLIMFDEESGTNWLQETGKAIEGNKVGLSLPKLDADEWESKIRWDEWKRTHPESKVLYCDHCENQ
jgi:hypothetical protein